VFSLLQGADSVRTLCDDLEKYGLGNVRITIGCDFGSDSEKIFTGSPAEIRNGDFGTLCVALIENEDARNIICGIPDTEFIRGDAPMTKSEIRMLSVAKLRIREDSVIYDVGAGTGSVSIELAQSAIDGKVYAIEMKDPAADLIEENKLKFRTPNVEVIRGTAPESMVDLPAPTHAFIGGSSGNLKDIVKCLLDKNPKIRIVMNAVTLETIGEIVSVIKELNLNEEETIAVSVDRTRRVGRYHLMDAQNPVYISVVTGQ
jgi:precorrin-6Y C5,15-methyltransferase (decarboxylating)